LETTEKNKQHKRSKEKEGKTRNRFIWNSQCDLVYRHLDNGGNFLHPLHF